MVEISKLDGFLQGFLPDNREGRNNDTDWVEWAHISQGIKHCADCLALDGCWFSGTNQPHAPLHAYCHCITESVPYSSVVSRAERASAYSKFDPYLFDPENFI